MEPVIVNVTNVTSLRNDQIAMYNALRNHEIGIDEVKAAANTCGKILGTAAKQMEYNKMIGTKAPIRFMEGD